MHNPQNIEFSGIRHAKQTVAALLNYNDALVARVAELEAALNSIAIIASCAPNDDEILAGAEFEKIMHKARASLAKGRT